MSAIALAIDGSPPQVSRISSFMLLTMVRSIALVSLDSASMKIAHELSLSAKGCTRLKARQFDLWSPPGKALWLPATSVYQSSMFQTSSNTMRYRFPFSCPWTAISRSPRLAPPPSIANMTSSSRPRAISMLCKTSLRTSLAMQAVRDRHTQILGKKRPLACGLLNTSCASAVFPMPPMPTMPTPVSCPGLQSLNALFSSSASCWSNPWIMLCSGQEVVQRLNPAVVLSSCKAAASPSGSFWMHRMTLCFMATTLFLTLLEFQALEGEKKQLEVFGRSVNVRHWERRLLSSYMHSRSSSALVEEMATFFNSSLMS